VASSAVAWHGMTAKCDGNSEAARDPVRNAIAIPAEEIEAYEGASLGGASSKSA